MNRWMPALPQLPGRALTSALLTLLLASIAPTRAPAADKALYALNLESSVDPIEVPSMPQLEGNEGAHVYATSFHKGEVLWHRLRLGPFHTYKAAEQALFELRDRYPQAWVTRLGPIEMGMVLGHQPQETPPPAPSPGNYVIHLESSLVPFEQPHAPPTGFEDLHVSLTTVTVEGRVWYRRNLESFPDRRSAVEALARLRPLYPGAWMVRVSDSADSSTTPQTIPAAPPPEPVSPAPPGEGPGDDPVARRMAQAGAAMTGGNHATAIDLYTEILALPESAYHAEALESLGIALTRQGLNGRARNKYREYLERYPNSRGSDRVREALAELQGLPDSPPEEGPGTTGQSAAPMPDKLPPAETAGTQVPVNPSTPEEELALLMEEARQATVRGNHRRAIQLYTKVLQNPASRFAPEAQELLGLSRERNGQLAHAKAEYERYLQLYPEGEGAERVQQRLQGLLTAAAKPRDKLRLSKTKDPAAWRSEFFGSVSQFYYRDETHWDLSGTSLNMSVLDSDADLEVRGSNERFSIGARFTGGYSADLADSAENEDRVSYLMVTAEDRQIGLFGRLGRQSLSTGGVLGRFDGGLLSYQVFSKVRFSAVAGYPVGYGQGAELDTDKRFYGFHFDWGTFGKGWDINTFYIDQTAEGVTDRRAVGGELRYFHPNRSLFGLIDYDIYHHGLNAALVNTNWILPNQASIHAAYNYRKSPFLTTSNALQGQGLETLHELRDRFTDDEILALAEDRTGTLRYVTVGGTYPMNSRFQVSADVTASELSGTEESGGVFGYDGTGWEYFYSTQLLCSDFVWPGDLIIFGLRYADTSTYNMVTGDLNTRFPVTRDWRVNPRLRVSRRTDDDDGSKQLRLAPSLLTNYRWRRRLRFELELGAEWLNNTAADREDSWGYFLRTGYRADF